MNVHAYYLLWALASGSPETAWRVEGGYDSCMLMQLMVKRYAPQVKTRCEQVIVKN